jgi:hypothetical protein
VLNASREPGTSALISNRSFPVKLTLLNAGIAAIQVDVSIVLPLTAADEREASHKRQTQTGSVFCFFLKPRGREGSRKCIAVKKSMPAIVYAEACAASPLENAGILLHVLNILGPGHHLFVSAMSKA